ncbi:MAG: pseudaminic acid cytidylyltransferase [Betaproteobacteria bacterium]|nr:pseudaminic acid cytidylyltransferase [Betaproteobacteria bacterium]
MNIAIIPARGGSKRIPRKNIKEFCGKPMIAYAINAAIESRLFGHIIVSTDDNETCNIATAWGAEVPFTRPNELADDHTTTVPVIAHAIEACKKLGWQFDYVCCIYPGVPLIQIDDIIGSLELLMKVNCGYCFPITEHPSKIQRALRLLSNNRVQPFHPEFETTRTQDLESAYYDAGQFYWGKTNTWLTKKHIHNNGIGYAIPNWRVVDIDTNEDWQHAERIFKSITGHPE